MRVNPKSFVVVLTFVFILLRTNGPAFAEANASTYTVDQASAHIGETASVVGVVTEVFMSNRGNIFLDFGGKYPRQAFTAVIFSRDATKFPGVMALRGMTVAVLGEIKLYKGGPEIILSTPDQLKVGD